MVLEGKRGKMPKTKPQPQIMCIFFFFIMKPLREPNRTGITHLSGSLHPSWKEEEE